MHDVGAREAVHFLHIRKTGGNALKAALRPVAAEFGIVLHEHAVTLADIAAGARVFFTVRDPVDRFVSGFNSRLRMGRPLRDSKWSDGEADAFARFPTPNDLAEALGADSEDARHAMREIRHVNSSLTDWLMSEAHVRARLDDIVWIARTESLTADFEILKHRLALPAALGLPKDDLAAHRTPDGFSRELSPAGRRNIEAWYAQDFRFLEFLMDARRGLAS